jgi:hypothetical protein
LEPTGLSVEEWVHRASMGRDHYVRVVYRGFLFPFGHRVSLVKVSERKFHSGRGHPGQEQRPGNAAYLRQRLFIVIRERERQYDDTAFLNAQTTTGLSVARKFPFSRVRILTETTPDLDPPNTLPSSIDGQLMFWPHVGGQPFRFQCVATDLDGRRIAFDLPMIFMDNTRAAPRVYDERSKTLKPDWNAAATAAALAAARYNSPPGDKYNYAELDLQRVALAASLKSGDTSVEGETIRFGGEVNLPDATRRAISQNLTRPLWVPFVEDVQGRIGPIAHLTGKPGGHRLRFNTEYLKVGFDPRPSGNRGEVFVDVDAGSGPVLDFSAQGDRSGGFVQPNIKPAALSRLAGPVMSDPAQFIKGRLPAGAGFPTSPSDLPLPLLFGCIPLGELIEAVTDLTADPAKVPKFLSEAGTRIESFVSALVRLYEFATDLAAQPSRIADAAIKAFRKTLDDLRAQAKAYAAAQVQPAVDAADDLVAALNALAAKVTALTDKALDAASSAPELADLPASIAEARARVAQLKAAANASPGGVSLPAGFRQSALNAAQKLDDFLADLQQLQALVTAGKTLWDALADLVGDPTVLTALFGNPTVLKTKVEALAAAIGPFKTALAGFRLLEGAPRKTILDALRRWRRCWTGRRTS